MINTPRHIQKRAFERVRSDIRVRFYCCDNDYHGTVTNLSENGMFISIKKMLFPFDSKIEIIIPSENKLLRVPVRVIRMTKTQNVINGIGVEVLHTNWEYIELVNSLKCTAEKTSVA
ncbi:MAG: PilZ domain-containing protein [Nitrospirae bacterium]|nr:PilZ domain-containing protein [Nitrospirota bacterium]